MKKYLAVLGFTLICLWGCSKAPVTLDDFKKTMEKAGYTIVDASGQYDRNAAEAVLLARKDGHQIEFALLTSEESAIASFESSVGKLEKMQSNSKATTSTSASNHNTYTLSVNDRYYKVSRIDRTLIYLNVPQE